MSKKIYNFTSSFNDDTKKDLPEVVSESTEPKKFYLPKAQFGNVVIDKVYVEGEYTRTCTQMLDKR